jgi:hypothetical protein
MLNKVPEVTVYFWVIKVLCTTVGETAADYMSDNLGLGEKLTAVVMAAARPSTGSRSCSRSRSARRAETSYPRR